MPTIDMQDTNRRAIVALDAGDISHAERLFARNYRAHPCLMTALNYANFLGDCHHLSGQGIAAEFVQRQRLTKSRKLLERCLADETADRLTRAHMMCLMGDHEYDAHHFPQARECFRKAVELSDGDPTIRLKTHFMLAWLAALANEPEEAAKLLDELGEMLELTDDFLDALARLEDFSPPCRLPRGETQRELIDCEWHRKQNKRGVPPTMYEELQQWIDESRRIVFFGGAGVSTESGIPDFRSQDGLYHQQFAYPPEEILSHTFFARHPEEFYRFYRAKMLPLDAQPNDAHRFLAQLEVGGRLTAVITQNIDGLHQKAGSKTVLELHGSIHRNYCLKCARFFPPEYIRDSEGVPKCPCGGIIKPDVVLYEEGLDDSTVRAAVRQLQQAELLIIAGTSLTVYPAASLLRFFRGRHIVLINRDATPLDNQADLVLHERVGAVCRHLRPTPLEVGE